MKLVALACHHLVLAGQWLTKMSYKKVLRI